MLRYHKKHTHQNDSNDYVENERDRNRVINRPADRVHYARVRLGRFVAKRSDVIVCQEHERYVSGNGNDPNKYNQLERSRLGHFGLDHERFAYDVVAVKCDEEDGQDGGEAHAVLEESNQVAPHLAQIPSLFGEQVVHARGYAREQDHEIGD
jgi:hypothetical protein